MNIPNLCGSLSKNFLQAISCLPKKLNAFCLVLVGAIAGCLTSSCLHTTALREPGLPYSTTEYMNTGIPAPDRPWDYWDYIKASEGLSQVVKQSPERLPRYEVENTNSLFNRIISKENVADLDDPAADLDNRIAAIANVAAGIDPILTIYQQAILKGYRYDFEAAKLMEFVTALGKTQNNNLRVYLHTLPTDDPYFGEIEKELSKYPNAASVLVSALLDVIDDKEFSNPPARRIYAKTLLDFYPYCYDIIPGYSRQEFDKRLARLLQLENDNESRDLLQKVHDTIHENVTKSSKSSPNHYRIPSGYSSSQS